MTMDAKLQHAVNDATDFTFLRSKAEIVEHYRDTYGKGWKQKVVKDLAALTGMKPKNLERRFDPSRRDNPEKKNAKQYETLGKTLPPVDKKPKSETITITVKGEQGNGRGGTRSKTVSVTLSGTQAYDFVNNPSYEAIYDEYGVEPDLFLDGEYELEVASVSIS